MTTMKQMAERVIKQMSRAEKSETIRGNMEPAIWVSERMLNVNSDQATRVAEEIAEILVSGKTEKKV